MAELDPTRLPPIPIPTPRSPSAPYDVMSRSWTNC